MLIFKSKWFARFARQNNIKDENLRSAIKEIETGLIDADLGYGVIKQRIARPGQGKSSSYRAIILFRQRKNAFFVYGFTKSQQENISKIEEKAFKEMAKHILSLSKNHLSMLIENGDFVEIKKDD